MDIAEKIFTLQALDKQRKRWRWVAVLSVATTVFIMLFTFDFSRATAQASQSAHIARVDINGMLLENDYGLEVLKDLQTNTAIKAVLVSVDSPGGTMTAGLEVYSALRSISDHKPVVIVMRNVAASAGYLVSLAGDHIFTNPATLTGSVGVFLPLIDATTLADKIGVKGDDVSSGALKTVTSPLWTRSASDQAYLQALVNRLNEVFYNYVTERRPQVSAEVIATIRDGRALVGIEAVEMGLVDEIGGLEEGRLWLQQKLAAEKDLPVENYALEEARPWLKQALEGTLGVNLNSALFGAWNPLQNIAVWAMIH